jgi:hypothetical protein
MVQKKVYVIEDWDSTISTIETLIYDHGLLGSEDICVQDLCKGGVDTSFKDGTTTFSIIIWKRVKSFMQRSMLMLTALQQQKLKHLQHLPFYKKHMIWEF